MELEPHFPLAAITDEFSPNLSEAVAAMAEIGMTGVELRTIGSRNILDLSDSELESAHQVISKAAMSVVAIASPLLKCVLPGGFALDRRFEQDVFASRHGFEDQTRLAARAFQIASRFKTRVIRVFSFWRTTNPAACLPAIMEHLSQLTENARHHDVVIALENEHACNIATAAECVPLFDSIPNLGIVWDPANALVAGESGGYSKLEPRRVVHVHAKDCHFANDRPVWVPLGTGQLGWQQQLLSLRESSYRGFISLETHWPGPHGNKLEASRICGWNLRSLAAA